MIPWRTLGLVGLLVCAPCDSALAIGCGRNQLTPIWRSESRSADVVAIGWIAQNRVVDRNQGTGQSIFQIERFVHRHPLFRERDSFTLDRVIPIDVNKPPQAYLVFADVVKGKIEAYRGEPVSSPGAAGNYLTGLLAIDDADVARRIEFCFKHTGSAEPAVAEESFRELGAVAWTDLVRWSRSLDRNEVRKRFTDPKTKSHHLGVLTLLLAGCGNKDDIPIIRNLLGRFDRRETAGAPEGQDVTRMPLDVVLAAFATLAPEEGFAAIHRIASNPTGDFMRRYAALRALRQLHEIPVKPIDRETVVNAVSVMLDQGDMADLPIDDLRRWGRWELTGKIVWLYGQKSHNAPIVKRAIIRFALCAPKDNAAAFNFLKERRAEDPDRVKEIEQQLLELERTPPKRRG